jgi:hypothetical protein
LRIWMVVLLLFILRHGMILVAAFFGLMVETGRSRATYTSSVEVGICAAVAIVAKSWNECCRRLDVSAPNNWKTV